MSRQSKLKFLCQGFSHLKQLHIIFLMSLQSLPNLLSTNTINIGENAVSIFFFNAVNYFSEYRQVGSEKHYSLYFPVLIGMH